MLGPHFLHGLPDAVLAAIVSLLACRWLVSGLGDLADRRGWMDAPGGRKLHRHPVPVVGGLAIMLAATIGTAVFDRLDVAERALMAALLLVCAIGWVDDRRPVRAPLRLAVHVAAALLAAWGGDVMLHSLGDLVGVGPIALGPWALPFTAIAMAGIANAFNLIDGLDGLAGGIAVVALGWFAAILGLIALQGGGAAHALTLPLAFAGAVLGFLHFNFRTQRLRRAQVFMGSAGSVMLGLLLAWLAVRTTHDGHGAPRYVGLWVLALPLFDTLSCLLRRLQDGHSPARPDRRHLHHLVLARTGSTRRTVRTLLALAAGSGAVGVAGWLAGAPEPAMFVLLLGLFTAYHLAACRYWRRQEQTLRSPSAPSAPDLPLEAEPTDRLPLAR